MIVTIHQPDFLPWLGFFDRWKKSDVYVVLDDVQFLRRGWHHRDKIKTRQGVQWLTVPVISKGKYYQRIMDVLIDAGSDWRSKHLKTIEANYKKSPCFEACFSKLKNVYDKGHQHLIDLNMDLLRFAAEELGITTPVVFASQYAVTSTSSRRLVDLVKAVQGNEYSTGQGSQGYLDRQLFHDSGISLRWQEFDHPVYPQLHGEFVPMLSCLDYLMMRTETR